MTTGFPTANFSDSEEGLFSPREIQWLMRIEYERAQRYGYPMVLMLVELDRLEYLHDLYGYESKEEILHAVVGQLRKLTRESDFLGCMRDERILAAFPHTPERSAGQIAGRLLQGSRGLAFESGGRKIRVTLSVGIAVSDPDRLLSFEEFYDEAHAALVFALRAGGDRYVRREPATQLIESLRSELEEEAEALREEHRRDVPAEDAASPAAATDELPRPAAPPEALEAARHEESDEAALERVRDLFDELSVRPKEVQHLERNLVELVRELLGEARASAADRVVQEHQRHVDRLERRLEKLKEALNQTEADLRAVAAAKSVDPGIASVYRSVQGLGDDEQDYERKKEMLTILFEANKSLRKELRTQGQRRPGSGGKDA